MTPELPDSWRPADAVLAIISGFLTAVVAQVALGVDELSVIDVFGVIVVAQGLGTVVVVVAIARRRSIDLRASLGLSVQGSDTIGLAIGAALQIVLSLAVTLIVRGIFGADPPEQAVVQLADEATSLLEGIVVVLGAGVFAPIAEELAFRGVLFRALLARRGPRMAVYGSAGAFAAVHLIDPNAIVAVPVLFVAGVVLARQTLATGRIARAVFTHIGFNLVSVAALLAVS